MGRYIYILVVLSLTATGCQKARMKSVPPKQQAATNAQPPPSPPPTWQPQPQPPQPPPPTWQPPQDPPPCTPPCGQVQPPPIPPPQPVQPDVPPNPVITPTQDTGTNPTISQPPVPPRFQAPPAIVDIPPPPPACNGTCGTERIPLPPPRPVAVCGEGGPCPEIQPIAGSCDPVPFSGERKANKLDVLFVVDTSASLRGGKTGNGGELAQIGRDIGNFVRELDRNTEYNIGVILGHGAGQWNGNLFQSDRGEPVVLRFQDYYRVESQRGGSEAEIRSRIEAAITRDLETKMMNTANERGRGTAQGEAMLYSLYTALQRPQGLQAQDMLRNDAALAVIFVTDEQDVCFDYTGTGYKPVAKGGYDSAGNPIQDPNEVQFFNDVCKSAANGQLLRPNHVHDALVAIKGNQKLIVTAIAYTDVNIPANPDLEDENERGHGVLELVGLFGNSRPVNLADVTRSAGTVSFAPELRFLGQHTEMLMKYDNPIKCTTRGIHPDAVDPATIRVTVKNAQGQTIGVFSGLCTNRACGRGINGWARGSTIRTGGPRGGVYLEVLMQEEPLKSIFAMANAESGTFEIIFRTKRGIDPRSGRPGQGAN